MVENTEESIKLLEQTVQSSEVDRIIQQNKGGYCEGNLVLDPKATDENKADIESAADLDLPFVSQLSRRPSELNQIPYVRQGSYKTQQNNDSVDNINELGQYSMVENERKRLEQQSREQTVQSSELKAIIEMNNQENDGKLVLEVDK